MKVLVIYGGPNNGLKKHLKGDTNALLKTGSKQVNVSLLNMNTQFLINSIKHELKNQRVAAVDEIEVICRHTSDLKDYIYEPGEQISGTHMVHDVKQLF
jgi:hypothetical protein